MSVKNLTLDQLKKEWMELEKTIEECSSVMNIIRFELLSRELENRGYEIKHARFLRKKNDK